MSRNPLTSADRAAMRRFVSAVETLMLELTPKQVGRIADYVAEHGTDGDGGDREDAVVLECLRLVVDAVNR
jgi:hypothetical protein